MPLSGRKVKSPERERKEREREEEREITPLIMATYVCHAVRTAHALRSTNNLNGCDTIVNIYCIRIHKHNPRTMDVGDYKESEISSLQFWRALTFVMEIRLR
jgi:hypothetical protein